MRKFKVMQRGELYFIHADNIVEYNDDLLRFSMTSEDGK